MTLFLKYSDPQGIEQPAVLVALGSNVRFGTLGLAMSADVGQPEMSQVEVDDPGGIYSFVGLRAFDVRETAAASNNQMIGRFVIQNRTVTRSPERSQLTLGDRLWTFDLADYNWHIGKRILVDSDSKRPAETAGDRLRWLLNNAAHVSLNDYGHVTYPSHQLDAHDYRGETAGTVLADCAVEGGYNFWADYNEAHGRPELFFIDPDGSSYQSTVTISNVLSDLSAGNCYAPYEDASLERSPERIAYGVFLAYTQGFIYVRNDTTGQQFAQVDRTAPMSTVHTAARARRVATKFLNDNATESDRITVSIKVPAANVNDVRHGQSMSVRFSHLPGYENFTGVRVVKRQVIQDEEGGADNYRLVLELVPGGPGSVAGDFTGNVFAGLQRSQGNAADQRGPLIYQSTYDPAQSGWDDQPVTGPITIDAPTLNLNGGTMTAYNGMTVSQGMTVRIYCRAQWVQGATVVMNVRVNGTIIATHSTTAGSGVHLIDIRDYHLNAGDDVTCDSVGTGPGVDKAFWSNLGTNGTQFIVGRGSFPLVHLAASSTTFVGP